MTVVRVPIQPGDEGGHAEFDVDDDTSGTEPLARRRRDGALVAARSLADSLDTALPALAEVLSKLRHTLADADEINLQAGLRVGGETGLVFVRGGADATINVNVTWRRQAGETAGTGGATVTTGETGAPEGGEDAG